MDERASQLIDRIYAAALELDAWQQVVDGVSAIFDGAPTMLGFLVPGDMSLGARFATGLRDEYVSTYFEHLVRDVPWSMRYLTRFVDGFHELSEVLSHVRPDETPLYAEWMKPQGLAPQWPVGHTFVDAAGAPVGGLVVFRSADAPVPFSADEIEEANLFVPHFRRALQLHFALHDAQRLRGALAEALDLIPTGLLLLDSRRRVVLQNRGAARIVRLDDGFRVDPSGPSAENARENAALQKLVADAMDAGSGSGVASTSFLAVSRPSGRQSFAVMVAPLLRAPGRTMLKEAVVAVFVADPEVGRVHDAEALGALYSLTYSEAELVRLLARGLSLEEAAAERGVSMNTARSHLKHVFAKTGTSRQGELLRLVISGVGALSEH